MRLAPVALAWHDSAQTHYLRSTAMVRLAKVSRSAMTETK
jgi:hypothetical protein